LLSKCGHREEKKREWQQKGRAETRPGGCGLSYGGTRCRQAGAGGVHSYYAKDTGFTGKANGKGFRFLEFP
jgi:hypothetical protein